jgi:hypothetical protein
MTCTEVQRTLVKSPPELWAELSDPDTLARHLSELGEVRITSVDPESSVRWEATDATGCIEIKPSAWGTKVTLSVTSKASETRPRVAPHQQSASSPLPAETPAPPSSPPAASTPEPSTPQPSSLESNAVERNAPRLPSAPEERAEVLSPAVAPQPATASEPAPASTPPIARSNPATPCAPVIEPATAWARKQPPAPSHVTPPAPDDRVPAPDDIDEDALEPPSSSPPAPEPTRRGFFSRLFRRRSPESPALEPPAHTPDPAAPEQREEPPADETPARPEVPSALEALQARFAKVESTEDKAVVDTRQNEAPTEQADSTAPADREPSPLPVGGGIAAEHPTPPAAEATPPATEASPAAADASGPSAALGVGAELRAAEELDPDDVRMILTGVLDRLGAAHHRPFSRA